jgi:hypothetical protein
MLTLIDWVQGDRQGFRRLPGAVRTGLLANAMTNPLEVVTLLEPFLARAPSFDLYLRRPASW